jgi:hypothetical protein
MITNTFQLKKKKIRIGYCVNFNLELLNFIQEPDFPATRVYLTIKKNSVCNTHKLN